MTMAPAKDADFEELFETLGTLGRGTFAEVRSCREIATGRLLAAKSFSKEELRTATELMDVRQEIALLENIASHDHIAAFEQSFEDSSGIHILIQLCRGGELFESVSRRGAYCESDAAQVFLNLLRALEHLHGSCGVLHRDIKPENILLAEEWQPGQRHPSVKLVDFGLAVDLRESGGARGAYGSPYYMAPEVVMDAEPYTYSADIWSLGSVLYVMLGGIPPFCGEDEKSTYDRILNQPLEFGAAHFACVSSEAKSLLHHLLDKCSKNRPTVWQLLAHPWVRRHCSSLQASGQPSPVAEHNSPCRLGAPSHSVSSSRSLSPPSTPPANCPPRPANRDCAENTTGAAGWSTDKGFHRTIRQAVRRTGEWRQDRAQGCAGASEPNLGKLRIARKKAHSSTAGGACGRCYSPSEDPLRCLAVIVKRRRSPARLRRLAFTSLTS